MALPWLFADAAAQSTAPSPITVAQTTVVLQSTSGFPSTGYGQLPAIILDSGNPAYNAANPLATPYEYVLVTANNTGTNTLTWTRGYGPTSPHAFTNGGATVAAVPLAEVLAANSGAFARIDKVAGALQLGGLAGSAGPPTAGTYAAGDEYEDSGGSKWACITAGTPGTWRRVDGWFAVGSPRQGSGGTINSKILMQTDSAVGTTNASGDLTINFPAAFPNGWFNVIPSIGDIGVGLSVVINPASQSASSFSVRVYTANNTGYSGVTRINYLAIGW